VILALFTPVGDDSLESARLLLRPYKLPHPPASITFARMPKPLSKKKKAVLLGMGLDSDGHKRVTTGENFALVGGTKDTHEAMTEKVIKINEKLVEKGKQLEQISHEEFDDIAHSVGLVRHNPQAN
jgi:hypothetical protein